MDIVNQSTGITFAGFQNLAKIAADHHQIAAVESKSGLLLLSGMTRPAAVLEDRLHILHEINFSLDRWRQIVSERPESLAEEQASNSGNLGADHETSPA
jgi:hypothetical protein